MSDDRKKYKRRVKLPDGKWGVYMGETGKKGDLQKRGAAHDETDRAQRLTGNPSLSAQSSIESREFRASAGGVKKDKEGLISRYSLSDEDRRRRELGRKVMMERRAEQNAEKMKKIPQRDPEERKFYHKILDKVHMWHLGITVNIESILKSVICGALILVFALLQVTVFSKLRPLGATPDLMLPLVIAIGISEGEKYGAVCALSAAFLIDCLGSAGITLLPLLYVPCAFAAGVLGTYYLRDSVVVRVIFSLASGILRMIVTMIYVLITFKSVAVGIMFKDILIPEFFSTLLFAILPHIAAWLSLKSFHKTRAERVE